MSRLIELGRQLGRSVWLFPVIAALTVVLLASLKISGSSIGVYYSFFYGQDKDPSLIIGQPRPIRSDEWLVNTEAIIAQSQADFPLVNPNIGNGQDMSVVLDVPYREWSTLFKPQNWGFFFLPLENAFALRWWLMAYLLVMGTYFFTLKLMPGQRLVAALLAISTFFSPFVQWWYTYGTLGTLSYSFFMMVITISLLRARRLTTRLLLGLALAYCLTAFTLILYPPFQVACGLVVACFLIGQIANDWSKVGASQVGQALLTVLASLVVAGGLVWGYIATRSDVIQTISQTEYPGVRVFEAGGFPSTHFWSSQLGYQLNFRSKTDDYLINNYRPTNQSEASNFFLLTPFLILPALALLARSQRNGVRFDWRLTSLTGLFTIFVLEMFVPQFTPYSHWLLLEKVGPHRLLIGLGLLNLALLGLIGRHSLHLGLKYSVGLSALYATVVFAVLFGVAQVIVGYSSNFVTTEAAFWLSLPLPAVIYLLLRGRLLWSVGVLAAFSFFSTALVNPLYRGLAVMTDNPLSQAILELSATSDERWATDGGYLTNIAVVNGARGLSAIYSYPQAELWRSLPGVTEAQYDRYAHVAFRFSDNPVTPAEIDPLSADSFFVSLYACDPYLQRLDVGFIVVPYELTAQCLTQERIINTPETTLFIYRLNFAAAH